MLGIGSTLGAALRGMVRMAMRTLVGVLLRAAIGTAFGTSLGASMAALARGTLGAAGRAATGDHTGSDALFQFLQFQVEMSHVNNLQYCNLEVPDSMLRTPVRRFRFR